MSLTTRIGLITKFNLLTITLILLTAMTIAIVQIQREERASYETLLHRGRIMAAMIAQNSEYAIYTENKDALQRIIGSVGVDADIAYVAVLNKEKNVLLLEVADPTIHVPSFPEETPGLDTTTLARGVVNTGNHKSYIDLSAPVMTATPEETVDLFPEPIPATTRHTVIGYVQLGLSQDGLQKNIQAFLAST